MKFGKFVEKSVTAFFSKKEEKQISPRIKRGRSPSSSAEIEDLLARAISDVIPKNYYILVDYPLSYKIPEHKRAKTIYPDIAIVERERLFGIIEFKVDLGYLQEEWSTQSNGIFQELKQAKTVTHREEVGVPNKTKVDLGVNKTLKRCVVVLTNENDHGRMDKFKKQNKCFVLFSGKHPNSHDIPISKKEEFIKELSIDSSGWDAFIQYLASTYK
jgi:hypothetical protein